MPHDVNGKLLNIGDKVLIPATITTMDHTRGSETISVALKHSTTVILTGIKTLYVIKDA